MSGVDYLSPTTIAEAVKALGQAGGGARLMAGGTDLLVQMRGGRAKPQTVIDIKRIPGLMDIRAEGGGFVIGAATSGAVLGEHAALRKAWPGIVEAANLIGSTQVQGRASLGGNLCNASPAADSVPALIAAAAVCIVEGSNGRREIPVEKVQISPGKMSLAPDEILIAFRLPPRPAKSGDAYLRLIPRTEMDIAVVGAGVSLTFDASGTCMAARVSVGAVAPTALLVEGAGMALVGSKLDEGALAKMDAAVAAACKPISDKRGTAEYRTKIACVLARRAALIARERAGA
ncbi:MAG: xanthine dehydrogenase family protein subunit M [Hyphomonadaceae bacterium]|nr:xanthine dehydrogenase family protein subunit M [Hyphomonadaceae bacterium]